MKYLSIDLGIKNLALCIVSLSDNDEKLLSLRKEVKKRKNKKELSEVIADTNEYLLSSMEIFKWDVKDIGNVWDSMDHLVPSICQCVVEYIHSHNDIDLVLIERQPAINKNTTILAYALFAHMMKTIDTKLVHGGVKMKFCKMIGFESKVKTKTKKGKYEQNKLIAVKTTKHLIDKKIVNYDCKWDETKKKDDLSDALLQAIGYHVYLPEAIKKRSKPVRKTRKRKQKRNTDLPKKKKRRKR